MRFITKKWSQAGFRAAALGEGAESKRKRSLRMRARGRAASLTGFVFDSKISENKTSLSPTNRN